MFAAPGPDGATAQSHHRGYRCWPWPAAPQRSPVAAAQARAARCAAAASGAWQSSAAAATADAGTLEANACLPAEATPAHGDRALAARPELAEPVDSGGC